MFKMLGFIFRCRSGVDKQDTANKTIACNVESVFGFKEEHRIASIPVFLDSPGRHSGAGFGSGGRQVEIGNIA